MDRFDLIEVTAWTGLTIHVYVYVYLIHLPQFVMCYVAKYLYFPGESEIIQVKPMEIIPVPLPFICATLHMKPSDWPVRFCDHSIHWQHVALAGDTKEKINKCRASDNSRMFRYAEILSQYVEKI